MRKPDTSLITLRSLLLIFTGGVVLLLLIISMAVSFDRIRDYMVDELEGRARDAATAVGLSLSNAIDATDPVAVGRLIDSVFDSGDYLSVAFTNHAGDRVAGRDRSLEDVPVPNWFVRAVELPRPHGTADVTHGWRWLGTVQVEGHPGPAYEDLWQITLWLTVASLTVGLFAILLLYFMLGRLLLPLKALEQQAEAIGRRDFRRRTRIRSTRELNQVTLAMNQMTDDLEQLFAGQAALIGHLRKLANEDLLTGLASRNGFDQRLAVEAVSEEDRKPGALLLIQVGGFAELNQQVGRLEADQLLIRLGDEIRSFLQHHAGSFAGRRSGAEFAVFIPGGAPADALIWGREMVNALQGACIEMTGGHSGDLVVHGGAAAAGPGVTVRSLFESADEALRRAQGSGVSHCELSDGSDDGHHGAEEWRGLIAEALERDDMWLWSQPLVSNGDGSVLCQQVVSRLRIDQEWIRGNVFVPVAERYGLMAGLDLLMMRRVLATLRRKPGLVLGVSVGTSSLVDPEFADELVGLAQAAGADMQRLWIAIPEPAVHYHRPAAQALIRRLRRTGARLLVDRFGVGGIPFSYMKNLSIQALRIDSSFVHGIDRHEENRFYLESVIAIAHGRGVQVFAAGVETESEWRSLKEAGIDGGQGYHLGRPGPIDGSAPPP